MGQPKMKRMGCQLKIVGSCCYNALPLKECGVCCESYARVLYNLKQKLLVFLKKWLGVYSVFVHGFAHSALQFFKCVCGAQTRVHSLSAIFTKLGTSYLHCTLVWFYHKTKYLLPSPGPSWLAQYRLTHLSSPHQGTEISWQNGTNNTRTPPYPKYYRHASSPRTPGLYHIQGIDHNKMGDRHDVK